MDPVLLAKLSPEARAALMAHLGLDESVKGTQASKNEYTHVRNTNAGVDENFGMSQFWYTTNTAERLAKEAISIGGKRNQLDGVKRIAFLSCPSAFKAALPLLPDDTEAILFEYDKRFADVFPDNFCFFDFNNIDKIPEEMLGTFDYVMSDPPYLDKFTMSQFHEAMKKLAQSEDVPMCFNTASVMDTIMSNLGFKECQFHPEHESKLGNDFSCFTTYNAEGLDTWYPDQL